MWNETDYAVELERVEVKNVMTATSGTVCQGSTVWKPACVGLVRLCQSVIDRVDEHRHLRSYRVLLLVKDAPADEKKLDKGDRVIAGKAAKNNAAAKMLSRRFSKEPAQFLVWLSDVWLKRHGILKLDKGIDTLQTEDPEAVKRATALIDHELLHCGAKIVGKFVDPKKVDDYVKELDTLHIETRSDVTDQDGKVLVRYYKTPFEWCMRHHDIEEFRGILKRHGDWALKLKDLVDVLETEKEPLFA